MADLIDRDALMKEICGNECGSVYDEECENVMCNYYDYIMDAPAVNRWIPVEDALPEVYEKVLTYNDEGIIHDNFRLNLRDGSVGWSQGWGITHWQPRPEPPEKK